MSFLSVTDALAVRVTGLVRKVRRWAKNLRMFLIETNLDANRRKSFETTSRHSGRMVWLKMFMDTTKPH